MPRQEPRSCPRLNWRSTLPGPSSKGTWKTKTSEQHLSCQFMSHMSAIVCPFLEDTKDQKPLLWEHMTWPQPSRAGVTVTCKGLDDLACTMLSLLEKSVTELDPPHMFEYLSCRSSFAVCHPCTHRNVDLPSGPPSSSQLNTGWLNTVQQEMARNCKQLASQAMSSYWSRSINESWGANMCKLQIKAVPGSAQPSQPTHPTHVSSGVTTCVKRPAGRAACGKAAERNPHEREMPRCNLIWDSDID